MAQAETPRYTFSWPITGDAALQPRGGSTQGADVVFDKSPSPAWLALQTPTLDPRERDRRAILAMAGTYRVTFDFLEIIPFATDKPARPYQSWGTEKVYVDEDRGDFISLVHILEMHFKTPDGKATESMVTKHWRQDWRYEPREIVEYRGRERWEQLLRRWHGAVCDLGVTGYPFDDALTHYREAALYYLSGAMSLIGTFDAGNDRGAAMAEAYSTRILNHVVDIDAAAVL